MENKILSNKFINSGLTIFFSSLLILNFSSGTIGGIWLLILKDWPTLLSGILLSVFMPWFFSIAMIPSFGLGVLIAKLLERKKHSLIGTLAFIVSLYNNLIILFWVFTVFFWIMRTELSFVSTIPYLLWGYAVVISPLSYMASKEEDDGWGTMMGVLIAQIGYILISILWFTVGFSVWHFVLLALAFSLITFRIIKNINEEIQSSENLESVTEKELFICQNCNKETELGVSFCKHCGIKLV